MSEREMRRTEAFGRVASGSLDLKQACKMFGSELSARQAVVEPVSQRGATGLQHGSCGRSSNHGYGAEHRAAVLK